jgi:two-component system, sensor histidine kinase and response regulator
VRPAAHLAGVRVLIVEDNPIRRVILSIQICGWGSRVVPVKDRFKALDELPSAVRRGEAYDLVLLDMKMPGMDGIELALAMLRDSAAKLKWRRTDWRP